MYMYSSFIHSRQTFKSLMNRNQCKNFKFIDSGTKTKAVLKLKFIQCLVKFKILRMQTHFFIRPADAHPCLIGNRNKKKGFAKDIKFFMKIKDLSLSFMYCINTQDLTLCNFNQITITISTKLFAIFSSKKIFLWHCKIKSIKIVGQKIFIFASKIYRNAIYNAF